MRPPDLLSDAIDLVLARSCVRCSRLGRVLCPRCLEDLRGRVRHTLIDAAGEGLSLHVHAALPYDEGGQDLVLAYKEHGTRALAPMLGVLLADAVEDATRAAGRAGAVIVPVPSHPRPQRGFDALGGLLRCARTDLDRRGLTTHVRRAVRSRGSALPMKSLSGAQRRARAVELFRAGRPLPTGEPVLIVDDVVTTGSTVRAMASVLAAMGADVFAVAALTAVGGTGQPG